MKERSRGSQGSAADVAGGTTSGKSHRTVRHLRQRVGVDAERVLPYPTEGTHVDVEEDVRVITDSVPRVRRGGGFPYEAAMMRSAARGTITALPFQRRDNVGFRVARTITP